MVAVAGPEDPSILYHAEQSREASNGEDNGGCLARKAVGRGRSHAQLLHLIAHSIGAESLQCGSFADTTSASQTPCCEGRCGRE
jgi:hypothetical protein